MFDPRVKKADPMLRSELVTRLQKSFPDAREQDIERMVDCVFDTIVSTLASGDRVELRGFGAFSIRRRAARQGRNPRTGATVPVKAKAVPFFKAGKELRESVDAQPLPEPAAKPVRRRKS
jgi:integration host factor subunit beta